MRDTHTLRAVCLPVQRGKHAFVRDQAIAFDDELLEFFPSHAAFRIAANPSVLRGIGRCEEAFTLDQLTLLAWPSNKGNTPSIVVPVEDGELFLAGNKRRVSPCHFLGAFRKRKTNLPQAGQQFRTFRETLRHLS